MNCRSSNEAKRRAWSLSKHTQNKQHDIALMMPIFFCLLFAAMAKSKASAAFKKKQKYIFQ
jgi:hypothetical protein